MDRLVIPVRRALSFDELKRLNPEASTDELADAFSHLPPELREQAWQQFRLRAALSDWNTNTEAERTLGEEKP